MQSKITLGYDTTPTDLAETSNSTSYQHACKAEEETSYSGGGSVS